MSWWSDLVLAVESAQGGESNVLQTSGPAVAQTPAPLKGIIDTINGITALLKDFKLWRSVGWLALGVVLILMGAWLIVGKPMMPPPVPL